MEQSDRPTYVTARWVFLRLLGVIYLIAFLSLGVQVIGLVGDNGMLPADELLFSARAQEGAWAYYHLPTLFWLVPSDEGLRLLCQAGMVASVLVILGVVQVP